MVTAKMDGEFYQAVYNKLWCVLLKHVGVSVTLIIEFYWN